MLVAASLDANRQEGRIFLAAPITLAELRTFHASRISKTTEVEWDDRDCLTSRQVERFLKLELSSRPGGTLDPDQVRVRLLAEISRRGLALLPWTPAARELQARLSCLRQWQPRQPWPDFSEAGLLADLEEWLGPWLTRINCLDQLARLDLAAMLAARLDWQQRQQVDELAPTHLGVPSGSRIRLQYQPGEPPVLAVRLQELFGLADTPTVCGGTIPVTLHLLSPAKRPVQITTDLRSFWNTTYKEVKKELQGRYPRHHWPDDPWVTAPTARIKRREQK
jgi:ATP-dependent helicase HrpB